nr:hypothetical protein BCU42_23735 [Vibrio splendidus]
MPRVKIQLMKILASFRLLLNRLGFTVPPCFRKYDIAIMTVNFRNYPLSYIWSFDVTHYIAHCMVKVLLNTLLLKANMFLILAFLKSSFFRRIVYQSLHAINVVSSKHYDMHECKAFRA